MECGEEANLRTLHFCLASLCERSWEDAVAKKGKKSTKKKLAKKLIKKAKKSARKEANKEVRKEEKKETKREKKKEKKALDVEIRDAEVENTE
jgi:hypothetical protein